MRLFFKLVLGILVLAFVAVGVFLIPPHVQTRGVEPPLPDEQALRTLLSVDDGPIALHYILNASQEYQGRDLAHTSFLIEWANGDLFMIDAGMDASGAAAFAELLGSLGGGSGEAKFFGTIGEQIGSHAARVKGMGFTHLHIDHTQGVTDFCAKRGSGTTLYQTDWQRDLHNFNTTEGAAIVAGSCLSRGDLTGADVLTNPDFPGLGIIGLGGHTPGSTLFAVKVQNHLWLFSGDTTNTKSDLSLNRGKGFVYSGLLVPENTGRTEELRLWLRSLDNKDDIDVVVSHDLAALEATGMPQFGQ